ncbi:hypothetical protein TMPK1_25490 [Rhodospirillales bacterium TMPK1]|uniref:Uncharacterized protein n=1 Tax=Roseiterribacter gracilis TaxID=2812848 RepID=A0A8S8XEC6_9PROT|nr:hypothetical protein TMPK1_25490 [Rhodospirillales bacterium TMPK1]
MDPTDQNPEDLARRWLALWQDHWAQSLGSPETAELVARLFQGFARDAQTAAQDGAAALAAASTVGGSGLVECERRIAELERRVAELESERAGGSQGRAGEPAPAGAGRGPRPDDPR